MKKPYKVYKIFMCDLTKKQRGLTRPYVKYLAKPKCENCDIFIEAFMKKHGLKKKEKEKK